MLSSNTWLPQNPLLSGWQNLQRQKLAFYSLCVCLLLFVFHGVHPIGMLFQPPLAYLWCDFINNELHPSLSFPPRRQMPWAFCNPAPSLGALLDKRGYLIYDWQVTQWLLSPPLFIEAFYPVEFSVPPRTTSQAVIFIHIAWVLTHWVWNETWVSTFLFSFYVMLRQLVWGPHLENHWR